MFNKITHALKAEHRGKGQINCHDTVPVVFGCVERGDAGGHAGATHQNIYPAEGVQGKMEKCLRKMGIFTASGQIGAATKRTDLFRQGNQVLFPPACNDDIGTFLCKLNCDLPANSTGGACDNCGFVFQ